MKTKTNDELFKETQRFINDHRQKYLDLIRSIRQYLEIILQTGDEKPENVFRIYSRKDCPGQDDDIKKTQSLTDKLIRFRQREPKVWRSKRAIHIHDIVACRVVVYYRHQIDIVVRRVQKTVKKYKFKIEYDQYREQYGYHAHHIVLSSRRNDLRELLCEIQIKTIVHDAWSNRTHEFTYKPSAKISRSARNLMESIGNSVEAIEVQTDYLRQGVFREWMFEKKLRHAARLAMLDSLAEKKFNGDDLTQRYKTSHTRLKAAAHVIADCAIQDSTLTFILDDIASMRKVPHGLEPAFTLMLLLASIREKNDLNYKARQYLDEWVIETGKEKVDAVFWQSSVLYAIGEREAAIHSIEDFLNTCGEGKDLWNLKFNLLNYRIESAMQETQDSSDTRKECEALINELDLHAMTSANPKYPAVQDTLGAHLIAFGENEGQIEEGITICRHAYSKDASDKAGIAFQKLHERMGWSKLLKSEFD